eukprot:2983948-Rhodomonas_salina.3
MGKEGTCNEVRYAILLHPPYPILLRPPNLSSYPHHSLFSYAYPPKSLLLPYAFPMLRLPYGTPATLLRVPCHTNALFSYACPTKFRLCSYAYPTPSFYAYPTEALNPPTHILLLQPHMILCIPYQRLYPPTQTLSYHFRMLLGAPFRSFVCSYAYFPEFPLFSHTTYQMSPWYYAFPTQCAVLM